MIGAIPSGLFGLVQPPQGTYAPVQAAMAPQPLPGAFEWGNGGVRLTPEEMAARRVADQRMLASGTDVSPVASWTQGAGRVAQALIGAIDEKQLDKQSAANASASQQILESLAGTGAGNDQATLAAIGSPYISDDTKAALKLQWQATHKTPPQPSEFERTLLASGIQPGTAQWTQANQQRLQNFTDPTINIPLPGGRVYVGPRSGFAAATGGGDPASVAPAGDLPPATLPPDFDFDNGGPTQPASATFR